MSEPNGTSPADVASELSRRLRPEDLARTIAELGREPRACLVCAAPAPRRAFHRDGKDFWRCPACGLVFVHDIYPEFLGIEGLSERYSFEARAEAGARKRRKYDEFLTRLGPPAGRRMLEIGCGQGLFLEHARSAGWQVRGIELLPPLQAHARARGLDVELGTLEDARLADGSADVVVLREVIEHIVEPLALLREIRRVLAPGGVAALGTGNAASWAARVRGGAWHYYRFGGHMHIRFYSPRSAAALARATGFDTVECHTRGFALRENGELEGHWYRSLVKLAQGPLSPLAGLCGAGQRLVILLGKSAR